ncbi:hypothetical protein CCR75_007261 [Bremia lactucae]|uniref:Uncharacterized protein n=1 Tax=Bremia lactucae TaxID=4779 RepID=A0A976IGV8_BRELC|nr:hypothetical protein CCR75_007261 [Bremia lactucae]
MKLFPTPTVDDNETRYCFFLPCSTCFQNDAERLEVATQQCSAFLSFAAQQTHAFIWHKHHFHLDVISTTRGRYILSGRTCVGDAIQDEWVIAKLVFDITTTFPGVVGRIFDSDGEFLLIESAEALPDWVTPQSSDGRVFVVNGKLHVARTTAENYTNNKQELYDEDALRQVLEVESNTEASAAVQRLIRHKLNQVPTYMRANRHGVRCLLPIRVARVFLANHNLVGAAVDAFYYREPKHASLICSKMATFMPLKDAVIEQRVTFSRAQFAQLKQQQFFPPKPFMRQSARYKALEDNETHPDFQAANLGVKLACGLELLYASESMDQLGRPWREIMDEILQTQGEQELSSLPIDPDDDDSWLYMPPNTLERELERMTGAKSPAANVGGTDELQHLANVFSTFVNKESGLDGVEGVEPVEFDMTFFLDILKGANVTRKEDFEDFIEENESSEEDEDNEYALDEAVDQMEAELANTTLAKSFSHLNEAHDDTAQKSRSNETTKGGSTSFSSAQPLDLDYNLLSNLLESFASQSGHAGPVSNILSEIQYPRTAMQ